jgi:hypothetical protein
MWPIYPDGLHIALLYVDRGTTAYGITLQPI